MQIDWWTLALEAINFLILVWLLQRFLFRPVMRIVERRRQETDAARTEAEQARRLAESEAATLRAERDRIEDDRRQALREARARAEDEHQRLIAEARQEAERLLQTGRQALETERAAVLEDLRGRMTTLATDMAAGLLEQAAAAPVAEAFLDALVDRLRQMPEAERQRLVAEAGSELKVSTFPALDAEAEARWRDRLAPLFGANRRVSFDTDASMIAGARLGLPTASLEMSWRQTLDEAKGELARHEPSA